MRGHLGAESKGRPNSRRGRGRVLLQTGLATLNMRLTYARVLGNASPGDIGQRQVPVGGVQHALVASASDILQAPAMHKAGALDTTLEERALPAAKRVVAHDAATKMGVWRTVVLAKRGKCRGK